MTVALRDIHVHVSTAMGKDDNDCVPVWAVLANFLIGERPSENMGEMGGTPISLETLIQAVYQAVKELKGIMLFPKVHSLTPQPVASKHSSLQSRGRHNQSSLYNSSFNLQA